MTVVVAAVLIGALLSAPLSAILLWLFRRSLVRGMFGSVSRQPPVTAPASDNSDSNHKPLTICIVAPSTRSNTCTETAQLSRAKASLRRSIVVYSLAGVVYALLFGMGWALQTPEGLNAWHRILGIAVYHLWPTVIAVGLIAATSRAERLRFAGFYFALLIAMSAWLLAISPNLTAWQLVVLWLITNGPGTFFIGAFLHRRIRAVGPLVLAFLSLSMIGSYFAPLLLFRSEAWMRVAVTIGAKIKLGGGGTFWAVLIIGFLLWALASWWLIRRFADLYRRKQLSDQTLTLDALFLVFTIDQGITLETSGAHMYVGIAAFVAYKVIVEVGLRRFHLSQTTNPPPLLLYLRVIALGHRGADLFDSFAKLWRRIGPIAIIAGPDLIRTTVEPHEFLEFLGGKMSRRFLSGEADMRRSVAALDNRPDPDRRYRVNQFFCHQNIWQMTMHTLAIQSAAVLMDLRNFSAQNQGCLFELGQLLNFIDLTQVVFLIDSTTDREFLEHTLRELWLSVPAESPNLHNSAPAVRFFLEQRGKAPSANLLFRELLTQRIPEQAAA